MLPQTTYRQRVDVIASDVLPAIDGYGRLICVVWGFSGSADIPRSEFAEGKSISRNSTFSLPLWYNIVGTSGNGLSPAVSLY